MSRLKVKIKAIFISFRKSENLISQNERSIKDKVDLIPLNVINSITTGGDRGYSKFVFSFVT